MDKDPGNITYWSGMSKKFAALSPPLCISPSKRENYLQLASEWKSFGSPPRVFVMGARHAYFGHEDWKPHAPGLKSIDDATSIRRRILMAFERAEMAIDDETRRSLLNFVVVGAGPTGVELAGTIAELAKRTLAADFRRIKETAHRI